MLYDANDRAPPARARAVAHETAGRSASLGKALLLIDVQSDFTGPSAKYPFPPGKSDGLIAAANRMSQEARKHGVLVVYIRHEFDGVVGKLYSRLLLGGAAIKGSPGTELDPRLTRVSDHCFTKHETNAFSNPELDAFLRQRQVRELYLAGLDGLFCVNKTAKGGLERGYRVAFITDAIISNFERAWHRRLRRYAKEGAVLMTTREFGATLGVASRSAA
jgi:nicotinamidase-related amidase